MDEYSEVIAYGIIKKYSLLPYANKEREGEGNELKRFILNDVQKYDLIYAYNVKFVQKIFQLEKESEELQMKEIKSNLYKYWATPRRIIHLPYLHLDFDPGTKLFKL